MGRGIERITPPGVPNPRGPYSPAVRAGDFIFVAGQGPIDPATNQLSTGEIFAGFMDYTTGQIDVYRSPDANGTFKLLPNPFPNIDIYNHARLRVDLATGALYVAGEGTNHVV